MGQLIKLQDYVSRYEQDIYRYPTQFVRLKKQQWSKLYKAFQSGALQDMLQEEEAETWIEEKPSLFEKLKNVVKRSEQKKEPEENGAKETKRNYRSEEDLFFSMNMVPESEEALKIAFLNQLFHFQMKWATTTIRERSLVDRAYYRNEKLKLLYSGLLILISFYSSQFFV